jgi:hypothetical protein
MAEPAASGTRPLHRDGQAITTVRTTAESSLRSATLPSLLPSAKTPLKTAAWRQSAISCGLGNSVLALHILPLPARADGPGRARVDLNAGQYGYRMDSAFLNAGEAAAWLRVSGVTLARWRIQGRGPAFRKFGRRVVYSKSDLLSWADAQSRASTSDTGRRVASTSVLTESRLRSAAWYRENGWR